MKDKKCTECGRSPIFKNVTEDGERKRLCRYCANQYNQKNKGKVEKQPTQIKQFSDKRAKRSTAYNLAKKVFMMEDKNKFCPVMAYLHSKTVPTTDIHHTNGRENERLTNRIYWLAVSREGHQWIHANPDVAREQGWLTNDYINE